MTLAAVVRVGLYVGATLVIDADDDEIEPLSSELYSQRPPRSEERDGPSK